MKQFIRKFGLPVFFLSSYLIYFGFLGKIDPFVVASLVVLYGWTMFIDHIEKPDYNYELHEKFEKLEKESEEHIKHLAELYERRIKGVEDKVGILTLSNQRSTVEPDKLNGFNWHGRSK